MRGERQKKSWLKRERESFGAKLDGMMRRKREGGRAIVAPSLRGKGVGVNAGRKTTEGA